MSPKCTIISSSLIVKFSVKISLHLEAICRLGILALQKFPIKLEGLLVAITLSGLITGNCY